MRIITLLINNFKAIINLILNSNSIKNRPFWNDFL